MNRAFIFSFLLSVVFYSCQKNKAAQDTQGFPKDVGNIINNKCSTVGCHTDNSKDAAGGLSLLSWSKMFEGGSGGAVVIPYRHDQSWLSYFVNTDSTLGIVLKPTMPENAAPLSKDEVLLLQKWIDNGAPSENGTVAFTGDPKRNKFYVINQGCGVVTVFDTKTLLAMRYINVGTGVSKLPHAIYVSPDKQYWYVIFADGNIIQKFRTVDDSYVGSLKFTNDGLLWNTLTFSNGGSNAYVVDFENNGKVAYVDLDNLKEIFTYQGNRLFSFPHGSDIAPDGKALYVTAEYGNTCYKFDLTGFPADISSFTLDGKTSVTDSNSTTLDPHVVAFSPDGSKYFVTCERSNEVRVFSYPGDEPIGIIKTGVFPQEIAFSTTKPYMFVSCQEDPCNGTVCKGSVYVIDYNTLSIVKVLQDELYQPHGVSVDDKNGIVIIASRNANPNGPAPHHTSTCGERNGFIRIVDLNTLEFLPGYRTEVSADPYFVSVRN